MLTPNNAALLKTMPIDYLHVFEQFFTLCEIPHGSGNSKQVTDWLINFAEGNKFKYTVDEVSNVLISVPATPGYEKAPGFCLQNHTDKVDVKKSSSQHNFKTDPLILRQSNGFVSATDTTLGADNGLSLAMAMSLVLDKSFKHGPIELLCTSDEEIGLVGASHLKPCLKSTYLINMDIELLGEICVSCAGGYKVLIERHFEQIKMQDTIEITIDGYKGGHSGGDIHHCGANAIKQMARLLAQCPGVRIASITGGVAHNVIPSQCTAVLAGATSDLEKLFDLVNKQFEAEGGQMSISKGAKTKTFNEIDSKNLINLILSLPHGPLHQVGDFVETSFALTIIKTKDGIVEITGSARSCHSEELLMTYNVIQATSQLGGWKLSQQLNAYPSWPEVKGSKLLDVCKQVYKKYTDDVKVLRIHAALEAGMICAIHPGMEAISIGPTILGAHGPEERFEISTVGPIYEIVKELISEFAK